MGSGASGWPMKHLFGIAVDPQKPTEGICIEHQRVRKNTGNGKSLVGPSVSKRV